VNMARTSGSFCPFMSQHVARPDLDTLVSFTGIDGEVVLARLVPFHPRILQRLADKRPKGVRDLNRLVVRAAHKFKRMRNSLG
jgi:hypothetical protein